MHPAELANIRTWGATLGIPIHTSMHNQLLTSSLRVLLGLDALSPGAAAKGDGEVANAQVRADVQPAAQRGCTEGGGQYMPDQQRTQARALGKVTCKAAV